jgi:hypothetical protein
VSSAPFGNDAAKTERYRAFWDRAPVDRPLVGFTYVGWFPLEEFSAMRAWPSVTHLTPGMLDPAPFLDDHVRLLREGDRLRDDLIRGACPTQAAVPFLPAMLGCRLRVLPESVLAEDRNLSWEQALAVRLDRSDPWYTAYLAFAEALVRRAAGRFPVSHGPELGPTDLHVVLRGSRQSIVDLLDEPERSAVLLANVADIFRAVTEELWRRVPRFIDGYFDAQYSLWAPGPIARLQEDATALFSPELYRALVQPVDRKLARDFACAFMHLHSTSLFLLDAFLEIEELRCFQVNRDVSGPPVAALIPFFQRIQRAERSLLVRGSFTPDELRLVAGALAPRGLFLNIMVRNEEEVEALRAAAGW